MERPELERWAVVELMGHDKTAGFVTMVQFGDTCMLHVRVPELPGEVIATTATDQYARGEYYGRSKRIEFKTRPMIERLYGMGAIFSITPCDEDKARKEAAAAHPSIDIAVTEADGSRVTDDLPF